MIQARLSFEEFIRVAGAPRKNPEFPMYLLA
jgi:hypothetical protein